MEDYPRTVLEFEERFATEEACRQYVADIRWPEGFRCPQCGHREGWITKRGLWHCKACGVQLPIPGLMVRYDLRVTTTLFDRTIL